MAKETKNPFLDWDMSKLTDMQKLSEQFAVPGVDAKILVEAQRKNIEALTGANQVVVQGMQAVAKRQSEILAQAMAEVSSAAQQIASAGDPQAMSAKQAELVRQAFEKAIANMRELAEMVTKSNQEAFQLINQRVAESLEELKAAMGKK